MRPARSIPLSLLLFAVLAMGSLSGCAGSDPTQETARNVNVQVRDVDPALRRQIGALGRIRGLDPIYVSGIGFVVGLNGTGSNELPASVRAWLISEMSKLGVGRGQGELSDISPTQLIDDPNTTVVRVEAVLPPAAPAGFPFDVLVSAMEGSSTTSLEGGRLWTTELYRGIFVPGVPATASLGEAEGDIFINPFAPPIEVGEDERTAIIRTRGRILSGGQVKSPFRPTLVLDSPSHARARSIVNAINSRFPDTGEGPVARGINAESIELNPPRVWASRSDEFFEIVKHLRVDRQFSAEFARRYADTLVDQPELAQEMKWSLIALGRPSLEVVRPLYDYPERIPRLAALETGAKLGDTLARPHLIELSRPGSGPDRMLAIDLLGELPSDRAVDLHLIELLDDPDLAVRVAAYETLDIRRNGVVRERIIGDKFVLHRVPVGEPLIYVTQQLVPRIAILGEQAKLKPGSLVSAWGRQFMVRTDSAGQESSVFYRPPRTRQAIVNDIRADAVNLVEYLAHKETPEAPVEGLDMNYSQVVGALYEVIIGGGLDAVLVPEADRLALERLRALNADTGIDRPELSDEGPIDAFSPVDIGPSAAMNPDIGLTDEERAERERRRARYVIKLRDPAPEPEPADEPPAPRDPFDLGPDSAEPTEEEDPASYPVGDPEPNPQTRAEPATAR